MKIAILSLLVVVSLLLIACTPATQEQVANAFEDGDVQVDEQDQAAGLIAGTQSAPYQEFTQVAYDQAIADGKKVFLHWYATWCPSCRAEQKVTQEYFNELDREDVIGFRVNYKDGDTDEDEEQLAREFGVTAQGTKVFLVNGERVHKTPQHFVVQRQIDDAFNTYFN